MFELPADASIAEAARAIGASEFDFGLAIFAITRAFAAQEENTEAFHDRLFESYDGSIDLYVRASCLQQWREIGRNDKPGRNTALDLEHLLYVSPGATVVTTDAGMTNAVLEAGGIVLGEESLATVGA
jgi:hypothetical protein